MATKEDSSRGYIVGELDRLITKTEENGDDVNRVQLTVLRQIYIEVAELKGEFHNNPIIKLGSFARSNPKTTLILMLMILIVLNLWAVPLLVWLGLPAEMIP